MKYCFFALFIGSILPGCAGPNSGIDSSYDNGLRYAVQSYSQPIDILEDEPFSISLKNLQNNSNEEKNAAILQQTLPVSRTFGIQIASFQYELNAAEFLKRIAKNSTFKFRKIYSKKLWRIVVGGYESRTEAEKILEDLKNGGFNDAWIIQF